MVGTNVPSPTFSASGFSIPLDSEIVTGVTADFQAAFGGNLNPAPETPQGQLIASLSAIIANADQTFLFYTTQVDPAFAEGRMQDAIGRIYFIERLPAEPTVAQCLCTGAAGTVIPTGAQAKAADGNIYTCTAGGTIPVSGSITLAFACNTVGPVVCPADTLNIIYLAIPGWDLVNNPTDGVIGQDVESRAAFEARRAASVALNSIGSLPSILGAVLSVPGVLDAYVTENVLPTPVTVGDFTLVPNSLYVAVVGGDPTAVATAIWSKKAPGCNYNGNTTVTIQDQRSGYNPPYPSYDIKFETPVDLPILFAVTIVNNPNVPANAGDLIKAAIVAAFSGSDGGSRARIGSELFASRYYSPVAAVGSWVQTRNILIGSSNASSAEFTAAIATNVLTVSAVSSGALGPGQTIVDVAGNVAEGTVIQTQLSGSPGGVGTYQLNNSQTVSSQDMFGAIANDVAVLVNIDQVPTISPANISVSVVNS